MFLSSTLVTLMPHGSVAISRGLLHLGIDGLPGGKRLVQLQVTDDITQGGGCQVLNGSNGRPRHRHTAAIRNVEKYHRINLHGYVILGDNRLGGKSSTCSFRFTFWPHGR